MSSAIAPVVVDLGKEKRKTIKDLKKGEGKLMGEVTRVLEEVRAKSAELASKELVPVVMIYQKKAKKKTRGMLPFGLMK
jgi:hypothetical protein